MVSSAAEPKPVSSLAPGVVVDGPVLDESPLGLAL
jgi:hypothetical protein